MVESCVYLRCCYTVGPVPGEPCYGNYMNIPSSTPSNEFVEMGLHHNLSDRRVGIALYVIIRFIYYIIKG